MAKLRDYPEEGELVVGTVTKVQNFGAFIALEEYPGREGFVHIREVAAGWVKRIRDYVREQQRVVCKVNGLDKRKGHVDLSLKAVNDHQRRETIQNWKNEQKADKLVEMFCEKTGMSEEDFQKDVLPTVMEIWGAMYPAFQDASEYGDEAFKEEGVDAPWVAQFVEFSKENIQAQTVELAGFVEIQSGAPDGVKKVSKALKAAEKSPFDDVKIEVGYLGAPMYRIEVVAPDFKIAEEQLRGAADRAVKAIQKDGGSGAFHRELEEQ